MLPLVISISDGAFSHLGTFSLDETEGCGLCRRGQTPRGASGRHPHSGAGSPTGRACRPRSGSVLEVCVAVGESEPPWASFPTVLQRRGIPDSPQAGRFSARGPHAS